MDNVTRALYEKYAYMFEEQDKRYPFNDFIDDADIFMRFLQGKKILDLGSGPGRDSQFFKERGLNPLCLDISQEMIKLCQEKGLETQVGDLEKLPFGGR